MTFDLHTVFFQSMLLMLLLGAAMSLYARSQRPLPGFGRWQAAAYLLGICYALFWARDRMPLAASVVAGNAFIAAGSLMRLDGTLLFLRARSLPRGAIAAATAVYTLAILALTLPRDAFGARVLLASAFIAVISWAIGAALLRHAPSRARGLYRAAAAAFFLQGVMFLLRVALWTANARAGIFDGDTYNALFLMAGAAVEVVLNVGFILLNAERLDHELRETQASLATTLESLEGAVAEVRTLEELLPFCAHCRKIRGEAGEWQSLDAYLHRAHGDRLSHAICPDCARDHFPAAAGGKPPAA